MGVFTHHEACDACGSSDGRAVYEDGSFYCWVCQDKKVSDDYKEEFKSSTKKERKAPVEIKDTKPAVTDEQTAELKSRTITALSGYRSLDPKAFASFGNRAEFDENDELKAIYYPCTQDNELVGWKCRTLPKEFGKGNLGRTGKTVQLYGQFKFPRPAKYVLIVGGENDTVAAWQMLQEYQRSKGQDFDTPVVSPTIGETGSAAQIAAQYAWLDQFETILLGMDNDDAGKKATEKILKVLPRGKVRIVQWSKKDPHEMLEAGMQKQFIRDYYAAKQYTPAGIKGSGELYGALVEKLQRPSIPLPSFLSKLSEMLVTWETNSIGVLAAGTGAAKTTVANEIIYDLIFNSPYKTGIVSLELDAGQYAQAMLSRHMGKKIAGIKTQQERLEFIQSEGAKQASNELFYHTDGGDRFMLIDEREGSVEAIQEKIEELVVSCGCKVIVCDPVSDIVEGLPHEEQAKFMKFLKAMTKSYDCAFLLIAHIRKTGDSKQSASAGAFVSEESIFGSGSLIKSASWVVMMTRDKYAEDPIVRNTTALTLSKNRNGSVTGKAGELFYDNETHRLYDKEEYFLRNPSMLSF
jgi:twinkle protein